MKSVGAKIDHWGMPQVKFPKEDRASLTLVFWTLCVKMVPISMKVLAPNFVCGFLKAL